MNQAEGFFFFFLLIFILLKQESLIGPFNVFLNKVFLGFLVLQTSADL